MAYCSVANGGYLLYPKIIQNIHNEDFSKKDFKTRAIRKVMSNKTSKALLKMMENVVNIGTATNAQIPGFRIGGKTGTAEKYINGEYSKDKFISSFAAIFPIDNPKYVCIVSVDSPKYGFHWGNEAAAPIVKEIFQKIIMNMKLDNKNEKNKLVYNFASK